MPCYVGHNANIMPDCPKRFVSGNASVYASRMPASKPSKYVEQYNSISSNGEIGVNQMMKFNQMMKLGICRRRYK